MWLTRKEIKEKFPNSRIHERSMIHECAKIYEDAKICGGAIIHEGAVIQEGAIIHRGARIGENRKNVKDCLVFNGLGKTKCLTAFTCDDGLIITIVCMNDYRGHTLEQTRIEIAKKYDESHEYFDALNLIEKWYKNLNSCG